MSILRFPQFDIELHEVTDGTQVSQPGRTYLARKWRLSAEVRSVIATALKHGLTCLWQQGHPTGDTSHHISFSFDRSLASWVFAIGSNGRPPELKRVTFHRRLKEYFKNAGLGWVWDWETAGGKNILVDPRDLPSVLQSLPLNDIRLGRLPSLTSSTSQRGHHEFFSSECDLEDELCRLIRATDLPNVLLHRQRSFASNDGFEVASRPDVLLVGLNTLLVIELKLGEAGDTGQLARYLRNEEIASAVPGLRRHGVLIADRFQPQIVAQANRRADVTLVRYGQGADAALQLNVVIGPDVLARYCSL
jgi:hypothetical protein